MRYQRIKIAVIVICVLAAGICYSCNRKQAGSDYLELPVSSGAEDDGPVLEETETETETQGQEVSVCYVHICGAVTVPGVYEMEEGSRIFQVVENAGGFTEDAATEYLNMAQIVSDGMKIVVPDVNSLDEALQYGTAGSGNADTSAAAGAKDSKVNINTATKEMLMTLKGIGEAKAEDIIKYREEHDGFRKIEDIMKISGIKDAAFQKIKDDITV